MTEGNRYTFECTDITKTSFKYFETLKNKKELCDVTLHIGSESIAAHRLIISAVIPYFRGIFISAKDQEDISMPTVNPNALKILIEFAYTCQVDIDAENVRNLLAASCYLGVNVLRDACCDFLIDILEYDNVLSIRELADSLNCTELLKCSDIYVKRNFEQVSVTEGFMQCPLTYVKELIVKDDINVDNEEKVFEAIINWIKYSPGERGPELPELMRKVRMPLLEPLYLSKIVEREEIIRSSLLCRDLIDEAKNYVQFPELRKSTCSFVTESRSSMKTTNIHKQYICTLHGEMTLTAQHFDLVENQWHTKETREFFIIGGSSAAVHNNVYFFYRGITIEYDSINNLYRSPSNITTPRIYATATALKNLIYVCGGRIGSVPCNSAEQFDPEKGEWRSVCLMKIPCWGSSSVSLDEYIFVLGGKARNSVYDTVQRYDSVMDKWKIVSPLLTRRYGASAATLNDKIYVCGGYVTSTGSTGIVSATAEVYNPTGNSSAFISDMTTARAGFILLSLGGRIYAIGGESKDKNCVKSIDVYDPAHDEWTDEKWSNFEFQVSGGVVV